MPDVLAENLIFQLRDEPVNAIITNNYFLETVNLPHDRLRLGGTFNIIGRSAQADDSPMVYLDATVDNIGSPIYYFPYIHQNAGSIAVRNNNIPEGTIVATGGMNGCALEVRYYNNAYHFYHDANGVNMPPMRNGEIQLCRIGENDYWNRNSIDRLVKDNGYYPIVQFVCIYRRGSWHVGAFGLFIVGGDFTTKSVVGTFIPHRGKYRGHFSHQGGNVI